MVYKKYNLKSSNALVGIIVVGVLIIIAGLIFAASINDSGQTITSMAQRSAGSSGLGSGSNASYNVETHASPLDPSMVSGSNATTKSILYMLEEEKLAHDVYQVMYEKWGSRVFNNISRSETNHQNEVLAVMQNRSIADPRSTAVGIFANQDLQALYNKLIVQGSQSITEAYKVGVAIEELDITDLKAALLALDPADKDVEATYESLLSGSQKHLVAFNRQLSR